MTNTPSATRGFEHAFRALKHRNYALFFAGQGLSLVGTWITRIAVGWLVYRLTDSAFMLGLVSFVSLAPTFLLTPLGGVAADRWDRHRVVVWMQVVLMITAVVLAGITLSGHVSVPWVIGLVAVQGMCNAFDIPARQAFVVDMVEGGDDLGSAIALNSMVFNGARLLGPSIAGVLIAFFGEGLCFLIDGVSYIAVIGALLAMRVKPHVAAAKHPRVLHALREGFRASFGFAPIRAIFILTALTSLVGMPYAVLMPLFADRVLGGDSITLGLLMAASGVGSMVGALVLAMREGVVGMGRVVAGGAALFGAGLIAFGLSGSLWISLPLLAAVGFGMMLQNAASNTIVQTLVDDDKRGRVMGFLAMTFMGTMPFGSLIAGTLAKHIGAPETVILGGGLCVLGSLIFAKKLPALRAMAHPVLAAKGILPPLPEGLGSAAALVSDDDE